MDEPHEADDPALDPLAILHALGHPEPARALRVTGGADTAIWRIEQENRRFALRVFRPEQALMASGEAAAMEIARAGGLPVPAVHAHGVWRERPALLLTWMPGRPLLHELGMRPWLAWPLGVALGRTQAAIHTIPVPSECLGQARSWIDWGNPDDALRRLLLERASGPAALLHLDLHPMNVLVQDRHVTAVLDWGNARSGDPRADLARTAVILEFAPHMPGPVAGTARRLLQAGWRRGYRGAAGPVHGMAPFYAWAAAAMVHDLSPRLGRKDLPWLTHAFLERVQERGMGWRARAGLTSDPG